MKNNIITRLFLIAVMVMAMPGGLVFAQVGSTISNVTNNISTGVNGLVGQSKSVLTDRATTQNALGSCDSTCDAMGVGASPAVTAVAAFITRVQACGAGYSGSKTQTRTQNPDGSYTAWVDADISQCVCAPSYSDSTQMCASPLAGTFVRRTPWVCSGGVGSYGTPTTVSSSCYTPCALPSPSTQYTTNACPAGYSGVYNYQRTASCPGGVGSNSVATWSGWVNTGNSCVALNYSYYIRSNFCGIYTDYYYYGPRNLPRNMSMADLFAYFPFDINYGLTMQPGESLTEVGSGGAWDGVSCPMGPIDLGMTSWG